MKNKKILISSILVLILILAVVGYSYSKWSVTKEQTNVNVLNVGCLETTFTEKNVISLEDTYPISDAEGMNLTPVEYTITNKCNDTKKLQLNLEILQSINPLTASQVKYSFNGQTPALINSLTSSTKTLSNATASYLIGNDTLETGATKTYSLRLWIDEKETTTSASNKTFDTKLVFTTSYGK